MGDFEASRSAIEDNMLSVFDTKFFAADIAATVSDSADLMPRSKLMQVWAEGPQVL